MHSLQKLSFFRLFLLIGLMAALANPAVAARGKTIPNPDFTKGESIPEGATKDWTLGATGTRDWIYSEKLETSKVRQTLITKVAKDSPTDGILKVGDVILGIGDENFSSDPRIAFGKALTAAESTAGSGKLELLRWHDGKTASVTVELPVLGDYSAPTPYDCAKSARILKQGSRALAGEISSELVYRSRACRGGASKVDSCLPSPIDGTGVPSLHKRRIIISSKRY